jgi:hypothetical protein
MKTDAELETLIQNLIERMNRVEAAVANMKPVAPADNTAAKCAIDQAIASLENAAALYAQNTKDFEGIVSELKAASRKTGGKLLRAN